MQYRFKAIISPRIEHNISNSIDTENTFLFLYNTIRKLKQFNTFIIFLIPIQIKSCFHAGKLRIILDEIISSQSNTIFYNNKINCGAKILINNLNFGHICSIDIFVKLIKDADFPIFLDNIDVHLFKNDCDKINCNDKNDRIYCRRNITIKYPSFDLNNVIKSIDFLIDRNYNDKVFLYKKIDKNTINDIMFLIFSMFKIDMINFEQISTIIYFKDFFHDISDCNERELKNILFCTIRGIVFPPSKSVDRKRHSIDIHPHNTRKIKGFKLFRIDVVNPEVSGIKGNSGMSRLLIGKKEKLIYVIAYTDKHDFDDRLVNKRIDGYLEKIIKNID